MNVYLHFLLVIKQMNEFTVSEAKDALLNEQPEFTDEVETRKFIYRQLTRNVEKGLLERVESLDFSIQGQPNNHSTKKPSSYLEAFGGFRERLIETFILS